MMNFYLGDSYKNKKTWLCLGAKSCFLNDKSFIINAYIVINFYKGVA